MTSDATHDLDRAVERLVRCPIGGAFLAYVDANATVAEAVTPRVAFALAAEAVAGLNPWRTDHERTRQRALEFGEELRGLARELLAHPGSAWWSAAFGGEQVWIGYHGHPQAKPPTRPNGDARRRWETYAQRPHGWRLTSRLQGELSCLDYVARRGGDWQLEDLAHAPVEAIEAARVYEVASADDWHRLCTQYPAEVLTDNRSPGGAGLLAPDWIEVAHDWDGVHLSFLGLLSVPFVRTETDEGASMLWSWDSEATTWLRPEPVRPTVDPVPLERAPRPRRDRPWSDPFWQTIIKGVDPADPSTVTLRVDDRWATS